MLAWGSLLHAHVREQHPVLGEGATAVVPSAPTVNLNVIIDVSVPARKKTGCCEQSGLPCPHRLPTLKQGPAPAATSVPSLLTCLRALVSTTQPCSPPPSLVLSPQRQDPPAWGENGSGPSRIAHGQWPRPRLPGAADRPCRGAALACHTIPLAASEQCLGRSHMRDHSLGRTHSTPGICSQCQNLS